MKRLGEYEVIRELGRGGMGVVLLAKGPDGTEVAVKLLQNLTKESLLQRFQREERLQSLLSAKEGFVPLLGTGESSEGPFFVMPFLKGGTLRDRLQKGMFDLEHSIVLVHSLSVTLAKAHDAGVVHRDMKPENVLFDEAGKIYVSDLGLAKHFRRDLPGGSKRINVTKTGQALGTTGYMAIEQMRDAVNVGPAADIFALGAILYECLIGRCPPYLGRQPLGKIRPDLPLWVSLAVEKALSRDPKDRYQDGHAFAAALQHAETKLDFAAFQQAQTVEIMARPLADTETRERFVDQVPGDPSRTEAGSIPSLAPSPVLSEPGFVSSADTGDSKPSPARPAPAPAAVSAPPIAQTVADAASDRIGTKADTTAETKAESSKVETRAEGSKVETPRAELKPATAKVEIRPATAKVETMPAASKAETKAETKADLPETVTLFRPPAGPEPADRTWVWIVILVIAGVAVGVVADLFLR